MVERVRADAGGPFKEFVLTDWVREGIEEMCHKIKWSREQLELENFRKHVRNTQKERLIAMRNMIDTAIERLEKAEE